MHGLFFFFFPSSQPQKTLQPSLLAALWSRGGLPPPRSGTAPFNPRRFSNDLPVAARRGQAERREMDTIMAGIKAALKCTWARGWFRPLLLLAFFFWNVYLDKKEFWQTYTGVSWKLRCHYKILTTKKKTVLAEFLWLPWSRSVHFFKGVFLSFWHYNQIKHF